MSLQHRVRCEVVYLVDRMLTPPRFLIFGDFRLDVPTRELLRIGPDRSASPVSLGSRVAEILLLFLRKPGELVSKDEIMDAVWPGTAVEEGNLTVQISALRRALGASCIQTIPGRGYRWKLDVVGADTACPPTGTSPLDASADI
jgi:DNA-binding winged helix-turn-helix (wHTH) protein